MHSEICPICLGSGKIACECGSGTKVCHGCNGRGWVEVSDSYWYPYNPYPYIWPSTDTDPYKWVNTSSYTVSNDDNSNVWVTIKFSKKKK